MKSPTIFSLPKKVTYNFLVDGFSKIKDLSRSLHYRSIMISEELTPTKCCLRSIISCSSELSDPGMCIWLSQELESRGWITHSTIQNAVVKGLLSQGKLGEAEKFVDRMVDKNLFPDGVIYDGLVKQLSRQGKMKKAVHLVNIMVKSRSIPTSRYDSLACGFCRNNELQQALDVHAEMLSRDLRPSMQVWAAFILRCWRNCRSIEAAGVHDKCTGSMHALSIESIEPLNLTSSPLSTKSSFLLQNVKSQQNTLDCQTKPKNILLLAS